MEGSRAMTMHDEDPLLTPQQVAKQLGVCTETVKRWMRNDAIAFEIVGPYRRRRVRQSVVEAQLREQAPRGCST